MFSSKVLSVVAVGKLGVTAKAPILAVEHLRLTAGLIGALAYQSWRPRLPWQIHGEGH